MTFEGVLMDDDGQYLAVLGQNGDSSRGFPVLLSAKNPSCKSDHDLRRAGWNKR